MAKRIEYQIVGRYMSGKEVTGYHLQSIETGKSGRYTRDQVAFLVGRDQITNCTAQLYQDKVLLRGKGMSLDDLPVKYEDDGTGRENSTRTRKRESTAQAMEQFLIVGTIKSGRNTVGYVIQNAGCGIKKIKRQQVIELARAGKIGNARVQMYQGKPLLRGINCSLDELPVEQIGGENSTSVIKETTEVTGKTKATEMIGTEKVTALASQLLNYATNRFRSIGLQLEVGLKQVAKNGKIYIELGTVTIPWLSKLGPEHLVYIRVERSSSDNASYIEADIMPVHGREGEGNHLKNTYTDCITLDIIKKTFDKSFYSINNKSERKNQYDDFRNILDSASKKLNIRLDNLEDSEGFVELNTEAISPIGDKVIIKILLQKESKTVTIREYKGFNEVYSEVVTDMSKLKDTIVSKYKRYKNIKDITVDISKESMIKLRDIIHNETGYILEVCENNNLYMLRNGNISGTNFMFSLLVDKEEGNVLMKYSIGTLGNDKTKKLGTILYAINMSKIVDKIKMELKELTDKVNNTIGNSKELVEQCGTQIYNKLAQGNITYRTCNEYITIRNSDKVILDIAYIKLDNTRMDYEYSIVIVLEKDEQGKKISALVRYYSRDTAHEGLISTLRVDEFTAENVMRAYNGLHTKLVQKIKLEEIEKTLKVIRLSQFNYDTEAMNNKIGVGAVTYEVYNDSISSREGLYTELDKFMNEIKEKLALDIKYVDEVSGESMVIDTEITGKQGVGVINSHYTSIEEYLKVAKKLNAKLVVDGSNKILNQNSGRIQDEEVENKAYNILVQSVINAREKGYNLSYITRY